MKVRPLLALSVISIALFLLSGCTEPQVDTSVKIIPEPPVEQQMPSDVNDNADESNTDDSLDTELDAAIQESTTMESELNDTDMEETDTTTTSQY